MGMCGRGRPECGRGGSISNWNVVRGSAVREQNYRDERDSINGAIWQEHGRTRQRILGTANSLDDIDIIRGDSFQTLEYC